MWVAACTGESVDSASLPTEAQLPSPTSPPPLQPTLPPTFTHTPTFTAIPSETTSATPSITPSLTITPTPTLTLTPTPPNTPEPNAVNSLIEAALVFTPLPTDFVVPGAVAGGGAVVSTPIGGSPAACLIFPPGGFGVAFTNNPSLQNQLGCPTGSPPVTQSLPAAYQQFEHGTMIWIGTTPPSIYVMYTNNVFQRFDDTYVEGVDPVSSGQLSPPGLFEPRRGFGKIWREIPGIQSQLGWATLQEQASQATVQDFENGRMVYLPIRGDILIFVSGTGGTIADSGTWQTVPGGF